MAASWATCAATGHRPGFLAVSIAYCICYLASADAGWSWGAQFGSRGRAAPVVRELRALRGISFDLHRGSTRSRSGWCIRSSAAGTRGPSWPGCTCAFPRRSSDPRNWPSGTPRRAEQGPAGLGCHRTGARRARALGAAARWLREGSEATLTAFLRRGPMPAGPASCALGVSIVGNERSCLGVSRRTATRQSRGSWCSTKCRFGALPPCGVRPAPRVRR